MDVRPMMIMTILNEIFFLLKKHILTQKYQKSAKSEIFQSMWTYFWGRPIPDFGCFWPFSAFHGPPRINPMFWIIFYDFNRPYSISWSCFILVWYMSGVIWKVISHVRKSECFWNWEIRSIGSLVTEFANFKTTHFFELEIWSIKWPQACTKPI